MCGFAEGPGALEAEPVLVLTALLDSLAAPFAMTAVIEPLRHASDQAEVKRANLAGGLVALRRGSGKILLAGPWSLRWA
jgi:hypothetical protein